jgi:soluble lytic murein transglycosylase-like protein
MTERDTRTDSALTRRRLLAGLSTAGLATLVLGGCAPSPRRAPALGAQPALPPPVSHDVSIGWLPESVARHRPLLSWASRNHGVDANLLAVVVLVESGGQVTVESPAGAVGLMQVMPATGADIASRRGLSGYAPERLRDPAYNVDFGAWYLSKQVQSFWTGDGQQTVELAAAAYNGGPGRLRRHLKGEGELPDETRRYRRWVGGMWYERWQPASSIYAEWMAAGGRRLVLAPS